MSLCMIKWQSGLLFFFFFARSHKYLIFIFLQIWIHMLAQLSRQTALIKNIYHSINTTKIIILFLILMSHLQ